MSAKYFMGSGTTKIVEDVFIVYIKNTNMNETKFNIIVCVPLD